MSTYFKAIFYRVKKKSISLKQSKLEGREKKMAVGQEIYFGLKIQINKYLRVLTTIVGLDDRFGR